MPRDLAAWWAALPEDTQRLFLDHVDSAPLPGEVWMAFARSGQFIAGNAKPGEKPTFFWPEHVRAFLEEQLGADEAY